MRLMAATVNFEALLFFASLVALWACLRPAMIRDEDQRPLPPNLTARAIFVFLYVVAYLGLAAAFLFSRDIVMKVSDATPLGSAFKSFQDQAPLLALMGLFALQALAPFRELERAFIIWTHSARHLANDVIALTRHLQECPFEPTDEERQHSIAFLEAHDIYLTDISTESIDLPAVDYWRKLATLLRLVRKWNTGAGRVLGEPQMQLLSEVETAHTRKSRLALEIVRMLDHVANSGGTGPTLEELTRILAAASHSDRQAVAEAEERIRAVIGSRTVADPDTSEGAGAHVFTNRTVRLSSLQLRSFLAQIQGYFQIEYRLLLQQIAQLAAVSIIHSGAPAAARLEQVKAAGFGGLGRLRPINFDRVLWVFVVVTIGGFLIFHFLLPSQTPGRPFNGPAQILRGPAVFALVMALSALVAALVGSKRALTRAAETPWGSYALGGLFVVVLYFIVHGAWLLFAVQQQAISSSAPNVAATPASVRSLLATLAPWAALPFLMTVGICRLARQAGWRAPGIVREEWQRILWERLCDGLVLGGVMLLAFAIALSASELLNIGLPSTLEPLRMHPRLFGPLMLLGFLIGMLAVREIRMAAHTEIIETVRPAT